MLAHRGTDMGEEVGGGLASVGHLCLYGDILQLAPACVCVCVLQFQRKNVFKRTEY